MRLFKRNNKKETKSKNKHLTNNNKKSKSNSKDIKNKPKIKAKKRFLLILVKP